MGTKRVIEPSTSTKSDSIARLRNQYGSGLIQLAGPENALYERHLVFDNVVDLEAAGPRERFEAIARSVRDILSQRWIKTENIYARENPKRVYYLSMEFLIGRSLANNVTNLLLDPLTKEAVKEKHLDWLGLLEQEPDAGLGNGGLGRLAACFLDSMATMQLPAMGYGLRYEYGIFKQTIRNGWQQEMPDNWLRRPDPWEVARPHEKVEIKLNCCFGLRTPRITSSFRRSVTAISLVRWLRLSRPKPSLEYSTRTTPRASDRGCALCRNIFSWPARLPISYGASDAATQIGTHFLNKSPSSSTIRTRHWRSPS